MDWRIHHKPETESTNQDARKGTHGDVYTAGHQTAGRGRLDHKWLSPPNTNLMMSVVLSVAGLDPEAVSTLPLVIGLAVVKGLSPFASTMLKWPNDVYADGRKLAGILCERHGDNVIVGIGVNVGQTSFPLEITEKATSIAIIANSNGACPQLNVVRDLILSELGAGYERWMRQGFAAVYQDIVKVDYLRGRMLSVKQTDDDSAPIVGVANGIMPDGSLDVGGTRVYAGEAHVERL